MATYTSAPVKTTRTEATNSGSNLNTILLIVILLATTAGGGYAWKTLHDEVTGMQKDIANISTLLKRPTTTATRGGINGTAANIGVNPIGAMGGGRRGGGGIANAIANLGLDDATAAKVQDLATQRQALLQSAQIDANAQGITRNDPAYQQMMDVATADIDGQLNGIDPSLLASVQNGGRRGGGGPGGAGGRRGAGGAGGGFGAGAGDPNAGN